MDCGEGIEGANVALSNEDMAAAAWMAEAKHDPQIEHLLNEVGRSVLGEQSDWCTDPAKLSKLAEVLGPQSAVMFQLSRVTSRQEQVEWLEMVVATTRGAQAPRETYEEFEAGVPESGRYSASVYDEAYQLYYRFDNEGSVYEWCANPHVPSPEWMSQSAADAMVAQRVPEPQSQQPVEQTGSGQAAEPAWAWDDGWGMFYRIGPGSVYEYSHSVDDARTRPDGVWLSGEQVLQQRQQAEGAQAGRAEPVAASGETVQAEPGGGGREERERGGPVSGAVSVEPLDLESALGVFERAGVAELREVVEDIDSLFAELSSLGIA